MNDAEVHELQATLWALMRRTRQSVAPIAGVSRSAARVLIATARHRHHAIGSGPHCQVGPGAGPDPHGTTHQPIHGTDHGAETDLTPTLLADRLAMASSNVAAALRELDEAGYIERRRSPADGRRVQIVLTDRGADAIAERNALRVDALRDVIDRTLSSAEQAQLAAAIPLLARLAAAVPQPHSPLTP